LASYYFFSVEDRKELLSRIEEAYLLLIDVERRDSYDQQLIEAGLMSEAMRQRRPQKTPLPLYETMQRHPGHLRPDLSVKSEPVVAGGSPAVRELLVKDAISGGDLKQARMAMGITLDHIARESRIKIGILQAIEEEEEDHLPPLAYLKGFIR
jgi:curved DNA-binding protein CbpA